jgi:hypothetical protein
MLSLETDGTSDHRNESMNDTNTVPINYHDLTMLDLS